MARRGRARLQPGKCDMDDPSPRHLVRACRPRRRKNANARHPCPADFRAAKRAYNRCSRRPGGRQTAFTRRRGGTRHSVDLRIDTGPLARGRRTSSSTARRAPLGPPLFHRAAARCSRGQRTAMKTPWFPHSHEPRRHLHALAVRLPVLELRERGSSGRGPGPRGRCSGSGRRGRHDGSVRRRAWDGPGRARPARRWTRRRPCSPCFRPQGLAGASTTLFG